MRAKRHMESSHIDEAVQARFVELQTPLHCTRIFTSETQLKFSITVATVSSRYAHRFALQAAAPSQGGLTPCFLHLWRPGIGP